MTNYLRIVTELNAAYRRGVKSPKVWITRHTKLSRCSDRAKYPGSIAIVFGEEFLGRIFLDGTLKEWGLPPSVIEELDKFANDFQAAADAYGKDTGMCCFCATTLTHENSIEYGYGPICAERYGLPHTYEKKRKAVKVDDVMGDIEI